ncbi:MAG: TatD family hydrolase [Microscillaceae bacterium]|nr:TatD family hydrolase [Microscillaceae bacterium]
MQLIDSHAHIYAHQFNKDWEEMIAHAFELGVQTIVMPNIDSQSVEGMLSLEEKYPGNCLATMGLHPCSVKADFEKELYEVENWLSKRKFFAVGEMGTDLYWDKTFFPQQQEAFKIQVALAKKHQLPIIIHCRDSFQETLALLAPLKDENLKGVFHCFGGSVEDAQKVIDLGFYLGIGGVVTFKKSGLDQVLPHIDLDYLLLETDSPYLAPVPHRGQRNEPAYIPLIAQKVAEIKGISLEEVAQKTTANSKKLFGLP